MYLNNKKYIFLITVDCLRADVLGYINKSDVTPNIDKLAQNSILFSNAYANGPGTNQSFPAILSSTYFLMNGFNLSNKYTTLAEILKRHDYITVAFHSNPFLSKTFGWNRGFDEFYDFMETIKSPSEFITKKQSISMINKLVRNIVTHLGANKNYRVQKLFKRFYYYFSGLKIPYLDGEELNLHVMNWVNNNLNNPFFLWMHYMDPHYPYIPPDSYLKNFSNRKDAFNFNISSDYINPSPEEASIFKELYMGEVRYTDKCIGELIEFLESKNLLKSSLIIFMADHGHGFLEHGKFGHNPEILYNEVLHIPLLIYGLDIYKEIKNSVQLLDIPPTIVDIIGIEKPITFIGDSLLTPLKEYDNSKIIFSESAKPDLINLKYDLSKKVISCIKNEWKLIINEINQTKELYNIRHDYKENNNVIEYEKNIEKDLNEHIKRHLLMCKYQEVK